MPTVAKIGCCWNLSRNDNRYVDICCEARVRGGDIALYQQRLGTWIAFGDHFFEAIQGKNPDLLCAIWIITTDNGSNNPTMCFRINDCLPNIVKECSDEAIPDEAAGIQSNRQVALALAFSISSFYYLVWHTHCNWRSKTAWPSAKSWMLPLDASEIHSRRSPIRPNCWRHSKLYAQFSRCLSISQIWMSKRDGTVPGRCGLMHSKWSSL